jgi:hypothetical protein
MSARVGASLLLALGVTDTIARDLSDMESVLQVMIQHPRQARRSRRRLERARFTKPLYDTGDALPSILCDFLSHVVCIHTQSSERAHVFPAHHARKAVKIY